MGGILHSFQISEVSEGGEEKISDPAENMVLDGQPVTSDIIDSGNLDKSNRNSSNNTRRPNGNLTIFASTIGNAYSVLSDRQKFESRHIQI
jgi:hypothetical protein